MLGCVLSVCVTIPEYRGIGLIFEAWSSILVSCSSYCGVLVRQATQPRSKQQASKNQAGCFFLLLLALLAFCAVHPATRSTAKFLLSYLVQLYRFGCSGSKSRIGTSSSLCHCSLQLTDLSLPIVLFRRGL